MVLSCLDEFAAGNFYGEEFAFNFLLPEIEEFFQNGKIRSEVEVLPDIGLQ